jgi:uncharacterized protein YrzB (UPF0473 family)
MEDINTTTIDLRPQVKFLEDEIITLTDDKGTDIEFMPIAIVELRDKEYILMQPVDLSESDMEEDEAIIMEVKEDPNVINSEYLSVEDDDLADEVFGEYLRAVADLDTPKTN